MMSKPEPDDHAHVPRAVPVLEETAFVEKRTVSTGKVRIATTTEKVDHVADLTLQADVVDVTRVPVDKIVDRAPGVRTEGDTTIVPILEEIVVVEKKLVLKEELHIRRRSEAETVHVPVTLRRQHAVVDRIHAGGQEEVRNDSEQRERNGDEQRR